MIVRRLAARLGGRAVLSMLSSILEAEADLPFAAALVQALNLILLTAPEARGNCVALGVWQGLVGFVEALRSAGGMHAQGTARAGCMHVFP